MPPSYSSTFSAVVSSRTSQRSRASAVNLAETSSSSPRSSASDRLRIVTAVPNEPKTWANSAATNPPPMIASRSGRASMRMIVSLVW